jgi:hypothetical protein
MADIVRGTFVDDSLDKRRLADRLFCLVEAPDAETAYQKALALVESTACDETYSDDDGRPVEMRAMGLADLREIAAPQLADGVAVYSEMIAGEPDLQLAASKELLTVFVPPEGPDQEIETGEGGAEAEPDEPERVDAEAPVDDRFTDNRPIR